MFMPKQMSVKEVAELLGVSIQTLHNWDQNGHLKASRTAGGHRRYTSEDVGKLLKEKSYEVHFSWEGQHLNHLEKLSEKEGEKDPRARVCGGFTAGQIGMMLQNLDTAHDDETLELSKNLDLFYDLMSSMVTPYLFDTRVIRNGNHLVSYMRMRGESIVCEMEEVCASSYVENYNYCKDVEEALRAIVKTIDEQTISDVISNCGAYGLTAFNDIESVIEEVIEKIDEATGTKEPKFVISPPELVNWKTTRKADCVKLNDNLKLLTSEETNKPYNLYISRLMKDNEILVGVKSSSKFNGYVFCPYMMMCDDASRERAMMRAGKKLLREGSKFFGKIEVV